MKIFTLKYQRNTTLQYSEIKPDAVWQRIKKIISRVFKSLTFQYAKFSLIKTMKLTGAFLVVLAIAVIEGAVTMSRKKFLFLFQKKKIYRTSHTETFQFNVKQVYVQFYTKEKSK